MPAQYDIFISYRRDGSGFLPRAVRDTLSGRGYSVFLDVESMRAGGFDRQLLETIRGCKDFILVLSPGALDRCVNEGDWLRQELACALAEQKNIIPLRMDGFEGFPKHLPDDIAAVERLHSLRVFQEYYEAMIDKLCNFLRSKPAAEAPRTASLPPTGAAQIPPPQPADDESRTVVHPQTAAASTGAGGFVIEGGVLKAYTGSDAEVTVPAGVTVIGKRAFYENKTVRRVVLPEGVTEIQGCSVFEKPPGGTFRKSALAEIVLPQSLQKIGDCAFADTELQSIELPAELRQIGDFAFSHTKLQSICIPDQVAQINNSCFYLCGSLKNVQLPHSIRKLGNAALAYTALEHISIPETVSEIGSSCFLGCRELTTVRLSRKTVIAQNAFKGCPNVQFEYID